MFFLKEKLDAEKMFTFYILMIIIMIIIVAIYQNPSLCETAHKNLTLSITYSSYFNAHLVNEIYAWIGILLISI